MNRQTDPAEIVKTLPDWVIEEALRRWRYPTDHLVHVRAFPASYPTIIIIAQALLEPAMEPPVDPLVMLAREICAEAATHFSYPHFAIGYLKGERDNDSPLMLSTIARLRQAKGEG